MPDKGFPLSGISCYLNRASLGYTLLVIVVVLTLKFHFGERLGMMLADPIEHRRDRSRIVLEEDETVADGGARVILQLVKGVLVAKVPHKIAQGLESGSKGINAVVVVVHICIIYLYCLTFHFETFERKSI